MTAGEDDNEGAEAYRWNGRRSRTDDRTLYGLRSTATDDGRRAATVWIVKVLEVSNHIYRQRAAQI